MNGRDDLTSLKGTVIKVACNGCSLQNGLGLSTEETRCLQQMSRVKQLFSTSVNQAIMSEESSAGQRPPAAP